MEKLTDYGRVEILITYWCILQFLSTDKGIMSQSEVSSYNNSCTTSDM